jgi:hypothetical protein
MLIADRRIPPIAVWTADASATVELDRLDGPVGGVFVPPAHLVAAEKVDLDDLPSKIGLYQACLLHGGPYDIYHWVNLPELLRVWHLLELPPDVAACWTRALHDADLLPEVRDISTAVRRTARRYARTGARQVAATARPAKYR